MLDRLNTTDHDADGDGEDRTVTKALVGLQIAAAAIALNRYADAEAACRAALADVPNVPEIVHRIQLQRAKALWFLGHDAE